jgi:hypothetical protein
VSAYSEAIALQDGLPRTGSVSWELGKVYNALLAAAKKEQPDSISLGALEPVTSGRMTGQIENISAESLRAMVAVVAAALKPPPSIA